jgi:UDP:flavonoid glycosyltransferase YjiC (YdhE family)
VTYVRFVPGSSILERSDALIFHGGQNTAMAALLHGVPSLIIPGSDFERDFNARSIARISAGIHMEADAFTSDQVLHATRRLLKGRYSQNAEVHGQYLKELGGPVRAAELLLSAAK